MWELPGAGVEAEVRVRRGWSFPNEQALGSVRNQTGKGWGTSKLWEITFKHERMRRLGRSVGAFGSFCLVCQFAGQKVAG